jgi:perosamine synthetase
MNENKGWRFTGNERIYLDEVLASGFGAMETGSMNERLENKFKDIHEQKYSITANSGTSTLHMALNAFGISDGDEVIIPALSVGMCGFAVWQSGGIPVFADVLEDSFLLDPQDIRKKITSKTKAIMAVHMYGNVCDMSEIMQIAKENKLYVLEDSAQCFLGSDDQGRLAGTIGDVGSWSFESSKHMTSNEGGIVTTDNEELALSMRQFGGVGFKNITAETGKVRISREKFQDPNWERYSMMGYNYRLSELGAAVALAQLEKLKEFVELRVKMAEEYREVMKDSKLFIPQKIQKNYTCTYWTFAVRFLGKQFGIEWQEFRKKYVEFGGDGIYAGNLLLYQEPAFKQNDIGYGEAKVGEKLQEELMLFTTNQKDENERESQTDALRKTIEFFNLRL